MQTNHRTHDECRDGERGVALLLTLGIISLLMIMAISFAMTARLDRQAASVNADMIKARLLAESGLERALGYLYHGADLNLYPGTGGYFVPGAGDWSGHWYMPSVKASNLDRVGLERAVRLRFSTATPNHEFWYTPQDSVPPPATGASWHHIKDGGGLLVGRIAFLAIDESGKIDPNLAGWERELSEWVATDPTRDPEDHDDFHNNMHPMFWHHWNALWPYARGSFVFQNLDMMPDIDTANRWFSWFHLLGIMPNDQAVIRTLSRRLFPWSRVPETFRHYDPATQEWHDTNDDRARFNLRRDDWETVDIDTVRSAIPWINQLVSSDGTDHETIRDQVAANLIAYSSGQNEQPPTDLSVAGTLWSAWGSGDRESWPAAGPGGYGGWPVNSGEAAPSVTYIGRKNVPYINELAVDVRLSYDSGEQNYKLDIGVAPELINIYTDGLDNCNLTVLLRFENIPESSGGTDTQVPSHGPTVRGASVDGAALHWNNVTVDHNSYEYADDAGSFRKETLTYVIAPEGFDPGDPTLPLELTIEDFTIRAFAIVRNGGGLNPRTIAWDAADMGTCDPVTLVSDIVTTELQYINFSATDPRANTLADHWRRDVDGGPNNTLGVRNAHRDPNADPSGGDDIETVTDPVVGISTAYVRNAPMQLLWEVGALHRGEPWQTLNLTAFNDGSEDRTWEEGDAAILDQVKLTAAGHSYYRVNANTPIPQVWRSLLEAVTLRSNGYDDAWNGGAIINPLHPGVIAAADNIISETEGDAFVNRGEIARVAALSDNSIVIRNNQREREELIGKLAHLLTTRQNFFRVLVTAQAVQDLGASPPGAVQGERNVVDAGDVWCRILAEQKIMAIVYRDAFNNTYRILRYEFLED